MFAAKTYSIYIITKIVSMYVHYFTRGAGVKPLFGSALVLVTPTVVEIF